MERANQALRRSSVKLKSLSSGHGDLNMIISDIKEMRSSFKSFHLAQVTTWEDMAKWANKEKTIALQEILHVLLDLCYLWSEVQLDFIAGLKKFKRNFELVLESETLLDKSKSYLTSCEQKENKLKKEIKKATAKGNVDEAKQLTEKHVESQAQVKVAHAEVKSKALENEAVKLMMVKEGLLNLSKSYLELTDKGSVIFEAHREVTKSLPDTHERDIEDIRYSGSETAQQIVMKTKEAVHRYKKRSEAESAPPPYSRSDFDMGSPLSSYSPNTSSSFSPRLSHVPEYPVQYPQFAHPDNVQYPQFTHPDNVQYPSSIQPPEYPPMYDLPPSESFETIEGAVGGVSHEEPLNQRYANI